MDIGTLIFSGATSLCASFIGGFLVRKAQLKAEIQYTEELVKITESAKKIFEQQKVLFSSGINTTNQFLLKKKELQWNLVVEYIDIYTRISCDIQDGYFVGMDKENLEKFLSSRGQLELRQESKRLSILLSALFADNFIKDFQLDLEEVLSEYLNVFTGLLQRHSMLFATYKTMSITEYYGFQNVLEDDFSKNKLETVSKLLKLQFRLNDYFQDLMIGNDFMK